MVNSKEKLDLLNLLINFSTIDWILIKQLSLTMQILIWIYSETMIKFDWIR